MTDEAETLSPISCVPTEILFNVFFFLPVKELIKCRGVCIRWKIIVDKLIGNENFWLNTCQREFNDYYRTAKKKAHPDLSWYYLYRSLSLWPKLAEATEEVDEFASAYRISDEVRSVEVLGNRILGVHRKRAIEYFYGDTFKEVPRGSISGDYARYTENDSVIVIQSYQLHLFIIRKVLNNPSDEQNATFDNVKMYLLTNTELYYVKLNDEIYVCNVYNCEKITHKFMKRAEDLDGVMSLGYKDGCLNVLTYQRNIYTIVNNKDMVFKQSVTNERNILNILYNYNFLENLDWRVYFQWMYVLHHKLPQGPMREIIVVRYYGDLFFVGTTYGVLSIFYRPFVNGEIDFFNSQPLREINFMIRSDIPVLATCPILQIDVIETEKGHTVFVAMPKKVAVLKYTHNFVNPACFMKQTSPYSEMELRQNVNDTSD
ncbi:unnamed protein product [Arctia plantaginis]|uniref:F-box domain-containing protein n=1 Tax=Arctia plantaginis TaxID=874455 RepID=A0A8S1ACC1_ARCPL|nr:unnamed protein product [Arctia plantaginis]